ncbi:hypothetical protein MMC17_004407 [Xylographa soralifera]|nr:hypothetical protein [Xylographa soralifera]
MSLIVIDPDGDLVVRVIEYEEVLFGEPRGQHPIRRVAEFRVLREVLIKSSHVFRKLLTSTYFMEASETTITLEEDRVASMEIWFGVLHNALIDTSHDVYIEEMWHLVKACDKYHLVIRNLKSWFATWYGKQDFKELSKAELLYPCFIFDHAQGFAAATKHLAYNGRGHIEEENPTSITNFHLPHRVIQQINAAKGRLRIILHIHLFTPIDALLDARCPCSAPTLKGYENALKMIGAWPIEREAVKYSMHALLEKLRMFVWRPQEPICTQSCSRDYKGLVGNAREITKGYFDGLCLDCIDGSKPRTGDIDLDYWRHGNISEREWFTGCRVRHRQPSWYFSFMGRPEQMNHFRKRNPLKRFREDDSD